MTDDIVTRLREFIRMGIAVGPFRAGFTEYNDPKEKETEE